MATLYFEDFTPGRVFELGDRVMSEDDIVAFAREWDPQPFHLDRTAAANGHFGGLIASGWHTACVWMRMYVDAVLNRAAMLTAPGVEAIRWLRPVRPGMRLRGRTMVLEAWPSETAAGRGTIRMQGELLDDDGEVVMSMLARGHARLRDGEDGDERGG
jgi:acyl dehydratase